MLSVSPIVQYVERFIVTGLSVRTQNSDEFNEKTAKIPNLWQQFYASELACNTTIFGVYSNYDSDADGLYTLTVGIASNSASTQAIIHAGNYLVFQNSGSIPAAVIGTWKQIWGYFEVNSGYQRNFISDFELYNGSEQVSIYIGIK